MVKLSLLAAFAVAFLAGGAAVAKEKAAGAPKEKKICKATKTTSSRIPAKRVCKTEAEWAQGAGQEELDDAAARLRGIGRQN
ncbi:hypothetical protein [Allosphingosinicella sp.]|uniref:hypothetical protein n=1 Tax=Allosphingosinicella sp. TaxID=2823234 RepID=UPI002F1962CF